MAQRIAIPMPHSTDRDYSERAIPQYEQAVKLAGGEPVRILLDQSKDAVLKLLESCDGVLLPGSKADVDPAIFQQERSPRTAVADPLRHEVDMLLLKDAYARRKPVLGICYGLQSLNIFHQGTLVQHIPDFLPEETRAKVNHEAGKKIAVAHTVTVSPDSMLAGVLGPEANGQLPVNSSHHQSANAIGEGLRIVARCPDDDVIEALEGISSNHFVLAVQWHPERSVEQDEASLAIFAALMDAARRRR